jgi:O-antigen ligase
MRRVSRPGHRPNPARAHAHGAPPQRQPRTRLARRFGFALVAALLVAVPLAFDPRAGGVFRLGKSMLAETLGLASLVALAFGARKLDLRASLVAPVTAAVAPFLIVATLVAPASAHPEHVARGLAGLWIGAACCIGWGLAFRRADLDWLLGWMLPGAAASGLLGLAQATGLFQPFGLAAGAVTDAVRQEVIGFAGNPGDLGASLVLPALVAQARLARGLRPWPLAAALICGLGVIATQTLAATLALAVGTALLWVPRLGRPQRWIAAAALALALLAPLGFAGVRERVAEKVGDVAHGDWNALLSGRLDGWRAATWMLAAHPWTGVGVGAYRAEFVETKTALLARGVEFFEQQPFPVFANAHSDPLEAAAETGAAGLVALGWLLASLASRLRSTGEADTPLALAGCAALALLALTGFPFRLAVVGYPALVFLTWVMVPRESEEAPE